MHNFRLWGSVPKRLGALGAFQGSVAGTTMSTFSMYKVRDAMEVSLDVAR
jgi:hypothetical protein